MRTTRTIVATLAFAVAPLAVTGCGADLVAPSARARDTSAGPGCIERRAPPSCATALAGFADQVAAADQALRSAARSGP